MGTSAYPMELFIIKDNTMMRSIIFGIGASLLTIGIIFSIAVFSNNTDENLVIGVSAVGLGAAFMSKAVWANKK
jgi:hypothetical protein